MKEQNILLHWLHRAHEVDLNLPCYKTSGAAGMDVEAAVIESVVVDSGARYLVPTGFAVACPEGYEIQVRPRSGLAIKYGVTIINSPGTIDSDYRGEVKIGLINLGKEPFVIKRGDRVAQLVLAPVCRATFQLTDKLDTTIRNTGGFGHTGV